jgi:hypothetical protein
MVFDVGRQEDELKLTITDRLGRMPGSGSQTYPLIPCAEEGVFVFIVPGAPRGTPVVFERWGDGRLYMHAGGRSTPKVETATEGAEAALAAVIEE